jgi:hypothetical protein
MRDRIWVSRIDVEHGQEVLWRVTYLDRDYELLNLGIVREIHLKSHHVVYEDLGSPIDEASGLRPTYMGMAFAVDNIVGEYRNHKGVEGWLAKRILRSEALHSHYERGNDGLEEQE